MRESRLKATALRKLAREAELECSLAEESDGRPHIVINPRESHQHHQHHQAKPDRPSIVTFQIPHSDSDQKQKKERLVSPSFFEAFRTLI